MAEKEKVDSEESSVFQLYKNFGDSTTMHGLRRVTSSRSLWKRLMWTVMVLWGAGWAVSQLSDVIKDFYTYPVISVLSLKHETRLKFPAITICNVNSIKITGIPLKLRQALPTFLMRFPGYLKYANAFLRNFNEEDSKHQISDMLISCRYNREICSIDNFTQMDAGIYGMCYTFNSVNPDLMYTNRAGPQNGLILELDVEHRHYMPLPSKAGISVLIHGHNEVPIPEEGGILAHPGVSTDIAFKKTVTHRLPPPYGTCVREQSEQIAQLSMFTDEEYTESSCRKSCYQLLLFTECQCCDADLPCNDELIYKMAGLTFTGDDFVPYCNTSFDSDLSCVNNVEALFLAGKTNCANQCPPACDQTTFDVVVSSALWPADRYFDVLLYKLNKKVLKNKTFDSTDDFQHFVRKNFLRLEIHYQTLDFLEIVTEPKYDWSDVLGDVGGHLGLWLGFSLLTAIELMELMIDTVIFLLRKLYRRGTDSKKGDMEQIA